MKEGGKIIKYSGRGFLPWRGKMMVDDEVSRTKNLTSSLERSHTK